MGNPAPINLVVPKLLIAVQSSHQILCSKSDYSYEL